MESKVYRCGYCGSPVDALGGKLPEQIEKRVIVILETINAHHVHLEHGECCVHEWHQEKEKVQITRDMAIDAGDRSLEGQWIKW